MSARSGPTPEGIVTAQVRNLLRLMRVPHVKHWSGPMSEKGIPDIIGTLPSLGRALYIELKAPGKAPSDDQLRFLAAHEAAGALAFWTADPREVVRRLAVAGYGPAKAIDVQLMGRGGAA